MVVLLLRDESLVEIPLAADVINKGGQVVCLGPDGKSLMTFDGEEVIAYTSHAAIAMRWHSLWRKRAQ